MKKIKFGLFVIVLLLIALLGYQNRDILFINHSFGFNLGLVEYRTPELPNVAMLAGFFILGCLLVYLSTLTGKFKNRKTIKELNNLLNSCKEENKRLENEVLSLSSSVSQPREPEPAQNQDDNQVEDKDTTG
ncbi:MAG: hypothetical protein R6U29_05835 [Desulfosudaceae bacterium]